MDFGLEYLLLFGQADASGRISLRWPRLAESQLALWVGELARWQEGRRFDLSLAGERVELSLPLNAAMRANRECWVRRRDLWSEQRGWERGLRSEVVLANARRLLPLDLSQAELRLASDGWVAPLAHSGLELVLEELNSFTQSHLRGPKLDLYFAGGIRELWMVSAETQSVEVYQRRVNGLSRSGTYGLGQMLRFRERAVEVGRLLAGAVVEENPVPQAEGGESIGLQQPLMAGLPARGCEYWDGWCRRFLPCSSFEQAFRIGEVLRAELERWDPARFRLHQRGMVLELAVRVQADLHRTFLRKATG